MYLTGVDKIHQQNQNIRLHIFYWNPGAIILYEASSQQSTEIRGRARQYVPMCRDVYILGHQCYITEHAGLSHLLQSCSYLGVHHCVIELLRLGRLALVLGVTNWGLSRTGHPYEKI